MEVICQNQSNKIILNFSPLEEQRIITRFISLIYCITGPFSLGAECLDASLVLRREHHVTHATERVAQGFFKHSVVYEIYESDQ
jgi:hypothetical protein